MFGFGKSLDIKKRPWPSQFIRGAYFCDLHVSSKSRQRLRLQVRGQNCGGLR